MPVTKEKKQVIRERAVERVGRSEAVFVAEYSGLKVEHLTKLRVALRKANAEFRIAKNRVLRKGLGDSSVADFVALGEDLKGAVGLVHVYGDAAAGAKVALDFEKENELFKVRCGFMGGQRLGAAEVKAISDLPSREVLLGQIVGSLVSPHRGILGVLNAVPRSLVQVINAIKDKKGA